MILITNYMNNHNHCKPYGIDFEKEINMGKTDDYKAFSVITTQEDGYDGEYDARDHAHAAIMYGEEYEPKDGTIVLVIDLKSGIEKKLKLEECTSYFCTEIK